ncbi:MAG TPA: hypothetical protein VEK73_17320, partial [Xanthobacteraceae bacterium]|nr:hypothetical protein [Xanthobacteraceae bacterium]
ALGCSVALACPRPRRHVRRCGWHRGRQSRQTAEDYFFFALRFIFFAAFFAFLAFFAILPS